MTNIPISSSSSLRFGVIFKIQAAGFMSALVAACFEFISLSVFAQMFHSLAVIVVKSSSPGAIFNVKFIFKAPTRMLCRSYKRAPNT